MRVRREKRGSESRERDAIGRSQYRGALVDYDAAISRAIDHSTCQRVWTGHVKDHECYL